MIKEIRILADHRIQYIADLRNQVLSERFRGRPVISAEITSSQAEAAATMCPTAAIDGESGSIDLGRCTFCNACAFMFPGVFRFSADYRIAASERSGLIVKPGQTGWSGFNGLAVRPVIRRLFRRALKLRQVSAGGDNSCEMELHAAGNVNFDMGRYGIEFVASPRHADGIVITGPVSENMADALEMTYRAVPSPRLIILCGTDAISGGLFAGSPAVKRDFIEKHHIDLYVPGNPAHPLTFITGIMDMVGI